MEALKTQIEELINNSQYDKACNLLAKEFNIKLNVLGVEYRSHTFDKKGVRRNVFKFQLKRGRKSYTFEFGQSLQSGAEEPTLYDVLACLQKYDVGTFENFCWGFGYDEYDSASNRTYKAFVKEFEAMERLFNDDELEVLQLIN